MMTYIVLLISFFIGIQAEKNNVCKNFIDYNIKDISPNCWYDPDVESRADAIIIRHGYKVEIHEAVTEDFFILTVFRIPPKNENVKGIMFLQHPAVSSSTVWLTSGNESLPFMLSDAGYDVWMGNFRTTSYSDENTHISKEDDPNQYWNYTFHEYGIYDIPAQIKLVREKTGYKQKVIYIGHSVATSGALVYSSLKSEEAAKNLKLVILWSPIAFMGNYKAIIKVLAPFSNQLLDLIKLLHLPRGISYDGVFHRFLIEFCLSTPSLVHLCSKITEIGVGPSYEGGNPVTFPIMIRQSFEGFSFKTFAHFGQLINVKDRFQWFDYGLIMNMIYYKSRNPPSYPLNKINVPIHIVFGGNDFCAPEEDAYMLYNNLPKSAKMGIEKIDGYNHLDFHFGKQVKELLHIPTLNYINENVNKLS